MFSRGRSWRRTWGGLPCPDGRECRRVRCLLRHGERSGEVVEVGKTDGERSVKIGGEKANLKRQLEVDNGRTSKTVKTEPPSAAPPASTSTSTSTATRPVLQPRPSYVQTSLRQSMVNLYYDEYLRIYGRLKYHANSASSHAIAQEGEVYREANKATYKNAGLLVLARLKKREVARTTEEQGLDGEVQLRKKVKLEEEARKLSLDKVLPWLPEQKVLKEYGFVVDLPTTARVPIDGSGEKRTCSRCKTLFVVSPTPHWNECRHHWGKAVLHKITGTKTKDRLWTCCRAPFDGTGCTSGPHVWQEDSPDLLHARVPFVSTPKGSGASKLDLVALDCEMANTTAGVLISRLCLVDGVSGDKILDELVRPPEGVILLDPNTRFSGVTFADLDGAVITGVESIRSILFHYIDDQTVLIGHGLDNDLKALRLVHHRLLDSALLYRHPKGPPFRYSLRLLATKLMGQFIQDGEMVKEEDGEVVRASHDAQEDAKTALELVRLKVKNGHGFGRII